MVETSFFCCLAEVTLPPVVWETGVEETGFGQPVEQQMWRLVLRPLQPQDWRLAHDFTL